MMKRLMTTAAAALLIGLPALASEGGVEAAHDALSEGAPAAAEVNMPDEADGRTFAEMGPEKHEISHRGRAFRALAAQLTNL